ncbi:MAG: hypothetical protein MUO38_03360, partial [Anaerolineales bacterium]|nr:hypothetical protein [Anaerolineales bacterium]
MIKIIRWTVTLAGAAALLILLVPLPAAAGGGSTLQSDGQPQPGRNYYGWVDIDVQRSYSVPAPRVLQNDFHFFIRRFRSNLSLSWGSGSNPPGSVTITPMTFEYYAMFTTRVEPDPDLPDMCRGHSVTVIGEGRSAGYSGSPSGSSTAWLIPG